MSENTLSFWEEYSSEENIKILEFKKNKIDLISEKHFSNHATRIINSENRMGFYVNSGNADINRIEKAKENAYVPVTVPSEQNNFVKQEFSCDIRKWDSVEEANDYLNTVLPVRNLDVNFIISEFHQKYCLQNSFGSNTIRDISRMDISLEVRASENKRLLVQRKYDSSDILNVLEDIKNISSIDFSKEIPLPKNALFIMSPQVVMEYLYPIQHLLINEGVTIENLNQNITLKECIEARTLTPFDDEGIKTFDKNIYLEGRIQEYVINHLSNGLSTGNGFRPDYRRKPKKAPLTWKMNGGESPLNKIVNSHQQYIFIDMIAQGRIDPMSGYLIYRVITSYLIEEGEIKGILPSFNIIADPVEIFEDPELLISKEREYTEHDDFLLPSLITNKMYIL